MFQENVGRKRKAQISLHSCACSSDLSLFISDKHYNQNYKKYQVSKCRTIKQSSYKLALMRMLVWSFASLISDIYTKKVSSSVHVWHENVVRKEKAQISLLVWPFASLISDIYTKLRLIFFRDKSCKVLFRKRRRSRSAMLMRPQTASIIR